RRADRIARRYQPGERGLEAVGDGIGRQRIAVAAGRVGVIRRFDPQRPDGAAGDWGVDRDVGGGPDLRAANGHLPGVAVIAVGGSWIEKSVVSAEPPALVLMPSA